MDVLLSLLLLGGGEWGGGGARFVTVVYVTETVVVLCPTCVLAASLGPLPTYGLQPDSLVFHPVSI